MTASTFSQIARLRGRGRGCRHWRWWNRGVGTEAEKGGLLMRRRTAEVAIAKNPNFCAGLPSCHQGLYCPQSQYIGSRPS
ncbi:hypothetical protein P8452_25114 [Trifolium repens]|nr:hypothetical protein P8452_25114 [Trifolium repens]